MTLSEKLTEGRHISVLISYATAHCAIGTSSIHGTIEAVTEKAVKIAAYDENDRPHSVWFPKKALVNDISETHDINCRLAHWFNLSQRQAETIRYAAHTSVISA